MSFHEIPRRRPGATLGGSVTAALYRSGRGASFRLLLGHEVLTRLGWDERVRATLLFGRGKDKGRARLQRTPQGGSKLLRPARNRGRGGCLVFSTQRLPTDIDRRPHSAATVSYDFADDGIEFDVPDWLNQPTAP